MQKQKGKAGIESDWLLLERNTIGKEDIKIKKGRSHTHTADTHIKLGTAEKLSYLFIVGFYCYH